MQAVSKEDLLCAAVGPMLGLLVGMSLLFPLSMLVRGIVEVIFSTYSQRLEMLLDHFWPLSNLSRMKCTSRHQPMLALIG